MLEYEIGNGWSAIDAQAHRDKLDGFAVASGLTPSAGSTGLQVDIASGTATVGETSGSVDTVTLGSSTTVTLDAADATHPRKDTIYIDTGGTVQIEKGTAEAADPPGNSRFDTFQPEPPLPSTDGAVLAEVWVGAGVSSLQSADVRDRRAPADVVTDRVVSQSTQTEVLNHSRITSQFADSGDGTAANPWQNALFNVVEEQLGHFIVPPGVYEEDNKIELTPGQWLEGANPGPKDETLGDTPRGVLIKPTADFDAVNDGVIEFRQGPSTDAGIEYMGLEGVTIAAGGNAANLLTVGGTRMNWIRDCVFQGGSEDAGVAVQLEGRITHFIGNEIVQNNAPVSIKIAGSNARSVWVERNNIVNTGGGILISAGVFGGIHIINNRIRQVNQIPIHIQGYTGSRPEVEIKIHNNRIHQPESPGITTNFLGPGIRLNDQFSATHPGPVWITENQIHGLKDDDTTQTNSKGIRSEWSGSKHGVHIKDNDVKEWGKTPMIDLEHANSIVADAEVSGNTSPTTFENRGTEADAVAIGSGDSTGDVTVSVTHGLALTPNAAAIDAFLSGATAQDYQAYIKEIRNIGSSFFDVVAHIDSLCSTTGETVDLSWQAKTPPVR